MGIRDARVLVSMKLTSIVLAVHLLPAGLTGPHALVAARLVIATTIGAAAAAVVVVAITVLAVPRAMASAGPAIITASPVGTAIPVPRLAPKSTSLGTTAATAVVLPLAITSMLPLASVFSVVFATVIATAFKVLGPPTALTFPALVGLVVASAVPFVIEVHLVSTALVGAPFIITTTTAIAVAVIVPAVVSKLLAASCIVLKSSIAIRLVAVAAGVMASIFAVLVTPTVAPPIVTHAVFLLASVAVRAACDVDGVASIIPIHIHIFWVTRAPRSASLICLVSVPRPASVFPCFKLFNLAINDIVRLVDLILNVLALTAEQPLG
jgi:hypothetical protein